MFVDLLEKRQKVVCVCVCCLVLFAGVSDIVGEGVCVYKCKIKCKEEEEVVDRETVNK